MPKKPTKIPMVVVYKNKMQTHIDKTLSAQKPVSKPHINKVPGKK